MASNYFWIIFDHHYNDDDDVNDEHRFFLFALLSLFVLGSFFLEQKNKNKQSNGVQRERIISFALKKT